MLQPSIQSGNQVVPIVETYDHPMRFRWRSRKPGAERQPLARVECGLGRCRGPIVDFKAALVAELVSRLGGEVPELTVRRPTLEDVYLSMIEERS